MEKGELVEKSLNILGWKDLCYELSLLAITSRGKEMCLNLRPEDHIEKAIYHMKMTTEMKLFIIKEGGFPISHFEDLSPHLSRISVGEVLTPLDLKEIRTFLQVAKRVKGSLKDKSGIYPGLHALSSKIQIPDDLLKEIEHSIDEEGRIREDATERLRMMIGKSKLKRDEIIQKLEAFIRDPAMDKVIQDRYYTQRDNRYVIPVKAEQKFEGIIHDISSSGSTHFVEPPWLLELNNQLKIYQLEINKEIESILRGLLERARNELPTLKQNLDILSEFDLILAKARLSLKLNANEPNINSEGSFDLKGLRHPLLVLSKERVVANDINIPATLRVLILSGPNAGGKTIILKALGLSVLMIRSGLHIPVEPGSSIPFIKEVFANIGDEQDLKKDISTFSGHIMNVLMILENSSRNSLVLLDELAGSTDPVEGEALAASILEAFFEKGTKTIVTTHYNLLKSLALMKEGYENASMEFDSKQMRPTYRIIFGLPGHSSPLEIASRLGLPEVILRRARELIIQKGPFIDEILKDIEKKRNKLDELQKEAISEMERAKLYREEAQKILAHLKQEELNFRMTKKKRLEKEISELSSRIKEIAKDLRNREDWDFIMKKRKELHEIEEELKVSVLSKPADKRIPITDSFKGDEVEILPLGKRGILLEDPKEKRDGPLRVKIGSLELQIDQKHLSAINSLHRWRIPSKKDKLIDSFTGKPGDVSPVILDIDLRGMSSEDALRELERFLDKAYLRQVKGVKIIHGHGTGTLKKAIREYLKDSSYVSRFSPGEPIDGGDGVTIVTLNSMGG